MLDKLDHNVIIADINIKMKTAIKEKKCLKSIT